MHFVFVFGSDGTLIAQAPHYEFVQPKLVVRSLLILVKDRRKRRGGHSLTEVVLGTARHDGRLIARAANFAHSAIRLEPITKGSFIRADYSRLSAWPEGTQDHGFFWTR